MRIRNRCSFTPSVLPSPAYLSLASSTPSENQAGTVKRELHPCETLLRRLREISLGFHRRCKRTPTVPVEETPEEVHDQEEEETKQGDRIQLHPNLHQHAPERGNQKKAAVTSIEDGSVRAKGKEKISSSGSSSLEVIEGTWLEEEKCFPLKKRKNSISWEAFTLKDLKMKTTLRNVKITKDPNDGVQGGKMQGSGGKHGNGVASKKNKEIKRKLKDVNHGPEKLGSRRSSIVIEGLKMTSNPGKREECPVPVQCTIAKRRGRRPRAEIKEGKKIPNEPNNKKGDAKMGKVKVGATPNSTIGKKRRYVITISVDEEKGKRAARDYAVIGRRGSRKQLVIDEEEVQVARSLDKAEDGAVKKRKRCSRYNGRGWRCRRATLNGHALCDHHLRRARLQSKGGIDANIDPPQVVVPQNNGGDVKRRTPCSEASPLKRKGKDAMDQEGEELQRMMMKKRGRREAVVTQ